MSKNSSVLNIHKKRRDQFFDRMQSQQDMVIIFSSPERIRSYDGEYPYRADSNLYYLSGFSEPEAALVLWKDGAKKRSIVFLRPRDAVKEHWTGRRLGIEKAAKTLGVDEAFAIETLWEYVEEWLRTIPQGKVPRLWTNAFSHKENLQATVDFVAEFKAHSRKKIFGFEGFHSTATWLRADRLIKDAHEIALMRESSRINVESHLDLLSELSTFKNEAEVAAKVEFGFRKRGASGPAYNSICASGANATILHYNDNNAPIKKGDLILIDAGCEYQMYASDITRTYPVSGKFNAEQKAITNLVSKALLQVIDAAKPGVRIAHLHLEAQKVLAKGLLDLGLLKGSLSEIMKKGSHTKYFSHGTSHFMGLDTHDDNEYVEGENCDSITLAPGMVLTVEPGLYFQENDKRVPAKYRGIGVRLEDDILITAKGCDVLTKGLPRTVEEIEAFMAKAAGR